MKKKILWLFSLVALLICSVMSCQQRQDTDETAFIDADSVWVSSIIEDAVNPLFRCADDAYIYHQQMVNTAFTDSVFRRIDSKSVVNIANVLINKLKRPVTKFDIADEYCRNRHIYDVVSNSSDKVDTSNNTSLSKQDTVKIRSQSDTIVDGKRATVTIIYE